VELGLSIVVLNSASHEWAHLRLRDDGEIAGDPDALSRLVSLGRFVFVWYGIAACLFLTVIGGLGDWFLARQAVSDVTWKPAWWVLVVLTSVQLWALPLNALLEGCNQVVSIQKLRFSQVVLRSLAIWAVLAANGQLWAAAAAVAMACARDFYLLAIRYRRFFGPFLRSPVGPTLSWRGDIWPMQWRLAVSGAVSYLLFQSFTPIMFNFHGPVVAGQMGMTLSMVSAVQGIAGMWLQPRVPTFGMFIARRDYDGLDRLWGGITRVCFVVASLGAVSVWMCIWALNYFDINLAHRLLPPFPAGLFLACAGILAVGYCETAYLRAHKREPLLALSIVTSLLMGVLVWVFGRRFGPMGAAAAYLTVVAGISFPWQTWILFRSRARWHQPEEARA
jgi:O-antigen/teichoic acid export membrane protein